jgi:energy-coupling factor transporter ATP-binding protein EcfA2
MFKFRTLILMRGIPGSGKSTIARSLAGVTSEEITREGAHRFQYGTIGQGGAVLSTDFYFMDDAGEYRFNPAKIGDNHGLNQACCDALMQDGEPLIVIDNTNTMIWEMEPYVEMAKDHGYKVVVVEVPHPPIEVAAARNSHGVPLEALERMVKRWQSEIPSEWSNHDVRTNGGE